MLKLHTVRTVVVAQVATLIHLVIKIVDVHPAHIGCIVQHIIDDPPRERIIVQIIAHGRAAHRPNRTITSYLIVQSKQNQMH